MEKKGTRRAAAGKWANDLAESSTPIFLLDAKRRLVVFSRGCTRWTGWTADEVLSQACDYVTEADSQSLEAVLAACAPPADVWQGTHVEVPVFIPHKTEAPRSGRIRFQPLLDDQQRVAQVWGQFLPPQESPSSVPATPAQVLHAELAALRHQLRSRYGLDTVVAQSVPMRRVAAQLSAARSTNCCVLFRGAAGSGREHLARVLHHQGPHAKQAFVPVDCRRSTSSELKRLLKHLREDRQELNTLRTGTLLLRDVTAAPRDVQERIAEWLALKPEAQPPRVLAAASESLDELVEQDRFHAELFYQLTTLVIDVPDLAQRPEDILPLAQFFLEECNRHAERQLGGFHADAAAALQTYRWPGHVAELKSVVQAAAQHATGSHVTPDDFPMAFRSGQDAQRLGPAQAPRILPLDVVLEQVEREQIQAALAASRENLTKAAELLGLSRPKLYRRLETLGLLPNEASD